MKNLQVKEVKYFAQYHVAGKLQVRVHDCLTLKPASSGRQSFLRAGMASFFVLGVCLPGSALAVPP